MDVWGEVFIPMCVEVLSSADRSGMQGSHTTGMGPQIPVAWLQGVFINIGWLTLYIESLSTPFNI